MLCLCTLKSVRTWSGWKQLCSPLLSLTPLFLQSWSLIALLFYCSARKYIYHYRCETKANCNLTSSRKRLKSEPNNREAAVSMSITGTSAARLFRYENMKASDSHSDPGDEHSGLHCCFCFDSEKKKHCMQYFLQH